MDSATALVESTSAAWMRRCRAPQPNDGAGARTQAHVFVELAQFGQCGLHVEGGLVQSGIDQRLGKGEGLAAHIFFGVLDHHLVHACLRRGGGLAEGDRAARLRLQAQGRRFQHMRQRHRPLLALGLQCADGREQGAQARLQSLQVGQGTLVLGAGHHGFDGGVAAPEIGAAQGADAGDFHRLFVFLPVSWGVSVALSAQWLPPPGRHARRQVRARRFRCRQR
jgi:hypothetical protein